jgi:hypothetical protein
MADLVRTAPMLSTLEMFGNKIGAQRVFGLTGVWRDV